MPQPFHSCDKQKGLPDTDTECVNVVGVGVHPPENKIHVLQELMIFLVEKDCFEKCLLFLISIQNKRGGKGEKILSSTGPSYESKWEKHYPKPAEVEQQWLESTADRASFPFWRQEKCFRSATYRKEGFILPRGVRDFTWATCCDKAEAYSGCMQEVEHSSSSSVARKQRQTERGTCPSNADSKTPHTPTRLHLLPSSHFSEAPPSGDHSLKAQAFGAFQSLQGYRAIPRWPKPSWFLPPRQWL